MDLSALKLMRAVAETGSVSRAAAELNCVQSNVTARLRRLEEDVGAPLFIRTARGMVPTAAGRVLDDYARRLLVLADEAKRAVIATSQGVAALRLGSLETTAAMRLPPVLVRFHKMYPAVELSINTGLTEVLIFDVLERRFDAALVAGFIEHPELEARQVFAEELVLVDDGAPERKTVLLAFRHGCTYRTMAETYLRQMGPFSIMEFGTLDGILGCVAAGLGCTILPRAAVERPHYAGMFRISSLEGELQRVPTCFIWRKDAPIHAAREAFARLLTKESSNDAAAA
jgi:LysR family transcriptional regulator, cell division regulator